MRIQSSILALRHVSSRTSRKSIRSFHRALVTLAIETSCDDTSVAILEKKSKIEPGTPRAILHFHGKVTANNVAHQGVHPLVALQSHQENLANLINEAIQHLPQVKHSQGQYVVTFPARGEMNSAWSRRRPDFISVTRGPGMRSNLFTGLDTAKGLAVAWQVDLVGVHHMQAHALTPRLVTALEQPSSASSVAVSEVEPKFPFLSVMVSGGHTMLLHSVSLTDHKMLGNTIDIAIGDCLDKIARVVLPVETLSKAKDTMYGAMLEAFAFPPAAGMEKAGEKSEEKSTAKIEARHPGSGEGFYLEDITAGEYCAAYGTSAVYDYEVPVNWEEERKRNMTEWGWSFNQPLSTASGGTRSKSLDLSFSGLVTAVERAVLYGMDNSTRRLNKTQRTPSEITLAERQAMAKDSMRAAFEHLANRVVFGLQKIAAENPGAEPVATVVMSGGVAANRFLRYILASVLTARGYPGTRLVFPPPSLCTDNAAMIAWAGLEMYEANHKSPLTIRAIRKWALEDILSPDEDA